jgi:hypothetical protein
LLVLPSALVLAQLSAARSLARPAPLSVASPVARRALLLAGTPDKRSVRFAMVWGLSSLRPLFF